MRRTNSRRSRFVYAFSILILLLLSIVTISTTVIAQDGDQLFIAIYDNEKQDWLALDEEDPIFLEGNEYDIEIYYENEMGIPINVYDVNIDFLGTSNFIASGAEFPYIQIEAPRFEEYDDGFVITASKEGYVSAEQYVIVLIGELFVFTERDTIDEEDSFSVTIKDQYDNLVSDVDVYVKEHESIFDTTNENGKAYISAPEVDTDVEINITAVKSGYYPGSSTIHIENAKAMLSDDYLSKIFEISPIVFALFVVLFAMLFVRIRKKTPMPISTSKTDVSQINKDFLRDKKEPWYAKYTLSRQTKPINKKIVEKVSASDKGPHVEVIRIHGREDKNSKTEPISDKKESSKVIPLNKNNSYEWFHGTDIMKYKIDKLTGDVNEKTADKWFIGKDNIRFKVDKKVVDKKLKKNLNKKAS